MIDGSADCWESNVFGLGSSSREFWVIERRFLGGSDDMKGTHGYDYDGRPMRIPLISLISDYLMNSMQVSKTSQGRFVRRQQGPRR